MKKIEDLSQREKFILSRWMYSIGEPIIEDAEYAALLRYMSSVYPEDPYVQRSWSSDPCPVELLRECGMDKYIHEVILGDKTESIPSLTTYGSIHDECSMFRGNGTLSMKHDGWNIQISYYNRELVSIKTRGRKTDALDASVIRNKVPATIPVMGSVKVVCEATVSLQNFKICREQWSSASPRSAVVTVLTNPDYLHLLDLHAFAIHGVNIGDRCKFDVLQEWGFAVPAYIKVHNYDEILAGIQELSDMKRTYDSPTDGVVYDGDCMRAFRVEAWEEPIYYSYVTRYVESYNAHRISPRVAIRPIVRNGTTQRMIPMTNWQRIIDNNLRIGYPIAFRVASSAIADFDIEATKLAQKEWEGNYEQYRYKIDCEEDSKSCLSMY